ncbi:MAG: hypothetical protein QOI74_1969 [Micromonosporaceae bacterium]|nr:hypothetical protein [Micromonosporaceae bacterium]MDT5035161.1 hypothetical protein [Micromonosporaceae bacterium]
MTTTVGDPVEAEPAAAEAPEAEPAGSVPARAEPAGAAPADARGVAFEPTGSDRDDQQLERGLRGLVGGGSSQVSVSAAMRARDAARPTEADLATAARDLPVIRRGWIPREDLPPRAPRR